MPLIPIISAATGVIIGWCVNDTVDDAKNSVKETNETIKKGVSYGSLAIAGVIAFVVLKKIKVI